MMGETADALAWKEGNGYNELVVTDIAPHTIKTRFQVMDGKKNINFIKPWPLSTF